SPSPAYGTTRYSRSDSPEASARQLVSLIGSMIRDSPAARGIWVGAVQSAGLLGPVASPPQAETSRNAARAAERLGNGIGIPWDQTRYESAKPKQDKDF